METVLNWGSNILLFTMAIPLLVFIYRYARYSAWQSTAEGRTIMGQKIAFLAYFVFIASGVTLKLIGVDYNGTLVWETIRTLIYLSLAVMFWRMLINLIKAQSPACDNLEKERNDSIH